MKPHLFRVLLAIAAMSLPGSTFAQEKTAAPRESHGHDTHFSQCARACHDCARICDTCAVHCARLVADGKKEHLHTLQTCMDCATICNAAAAVTARSGLFSDAICVACAEACKRCGDACEKHASDPVMKQCAEECRKCEKACLEMLKHLRASDKR